MATITHGNPYTHEQHTRISKSAKDIGTCDTMSCAWCGAGHKHVLYQYDGTRGWFCNLVCWRSYHA